MLISVGATADEDDVLAGAIDLNDVDWASNSDLEGGLVGTLDMIPLGSPMRIHRQGSGSDVSSVARNGDGPSLTAGATAASLAARSYVTSPPRVVPPLFTGHPPATSPSASAANSRSTRGSRNQRTSPFNLKACSACKKGKASPIACRVDRRHWEDPDWTDPPSRPWVMPPGFVDWLAKEDRGPRGEKPGSPTNAATAAAAAEAAAAMSARAAAKKQDAAAEAGSVNKVPGPRPPRVESASSLLQRMLGSAALPAPAPTPIAPAPILAARVAPGAPVAGGGGFRRARCMANGCTTAVAKDAAFCSDDCVVGAQKTAALALLYHRRREQQHSANGRGAGRGEGEAGATRAVGGSGGGNAVAAGGEGGGAASASAAASGAPKWTAQDREEFTKGLEAVRARGAQTAAQRFRHKLMDRFRELFAEGMAELGVDTEDDPDVAMLSGVLAWDLEHELHVFSHGDRGVYKEKAQSLRFNIKFAKNPELFKVRWSRWEGRGGRSGGPGGGGSLRVNVVWFYVLFYFIFCGCGRRVVGCTAWLPIRFFPHSLTFLCTYENCQRHLSIMEWSLLKLHVARLLRRTPVPPPAAVSHSSSLAHTSLRFGFLASIVVCHWVFHWPPPSAARLDTCYFTTHCMSWQKLSAIFCRNVDLGFHVSNLSVDHRTVI